MSQEFIPIGQLRLFCRHCNRVMPAQLERSIAGTGRVVDQQSTFEYYCSKCHRTICYSGKDLMQILEEQQAESISPRSYSPREHFLIGEVIQHGGFNECGTIVGKDIGAPTRILVQFEKSGLKKLVENV